MRSLCWAMWGIVGLVALFSLDRRPLLGYPAYWRYVLLGATIVGAVLYTIGTRNMPPRPR